MKRELMTLALTMFALVFTAVSVADDTQSSVPGAVSASQRAARPRQAASGVAGGNSSVNTGGSAAGSGGGDAKAAAAPGDAPKFVSEAKWQLAGYNNDEIVYSVFVTNQDTRIIRCTTEVKGFYFENGKDGPRLSISDRQITTVFPNEPTRVGYWMDMDQQSGATYSVKCHTL